MATINLKTKFFPLAFLLYLFPPRVVIDGGEPLKIGWGDNSLQVAPGSHRVAIYHPYLWVFRAGKASFDVTVQAGQAISVTYKAPTWFVFAPGKTQMA
jgi:hypothetical protein